MDIANPVTREVTNVSFSFHTADDIRKLSVKQITNPIIFDTLNHPTKGGLYDPALGPTEKSANCTTCGLNYFECPGHFGHIELASVCYNPITFKLMYKMLGSLCFYCHKFRMSRMQIAHFSAKLKLIRAGCIVEACELDSFLNSKFKDKKKNSKIKSEDEENSQILMDLEAVEGSDGDAEELSTEELLMNEELSKTNPQNEQEFLDEIVLYVSRCLSEKKDDPVRKAIKTTQSTDTIKQIERAFLRSISPQSCPNCRGQSPKFRKEGMSKIFQRGLSAKQFKSMRSKGMIYQKLFCHGNSAAAVNTNENMDEDNSDAESIKELEKEKRPDYVLLDNMQNTRYITPLEVKEHLEMLWDCEKEVLDLLYGSEVTEAALQKKSRVSSPDMFFLNVLAVPPNKFRPISKMNDMTYEHPQNTYLADVLKANALIIDLLRQRQQSESDPKKRDELLSRLGNACVTLQSSAINFLDSSNAPLMNGKPAPPGIRQLLEKKEGLFRKHMMGKRVNYAARSVISPDPNIETSEIGIPPVFATKLTYPEPVTPLNFEILRRAVINGAHVWPGASHVQNEDGTLVNLAMFDEAGRTAIANQLLTPPSQDNPHGSEVSRYANKKVYRHLRNGDFLLLNRQPTLHKPSIMGHTARVLPGEKTIRMHYANCNTYNADFDGDEMNVHFPQNPVARAEAMLIARTDLQYLVPTDGGVLRGLIQDHVCAGVEMTCRNTMLTREEYMQLLYVALKPDGVTSASTISNNPNTGDGNIEEALIIGDHGKIVTMEPAIYKPTPRWTGKQVISTVLLNLTYSSPPLHLISKAKVPAKSWGPSAPEEQTVMVMDGELLTGVLDKSQFGASAHGLVHAVYEIYGPRYAGKLLSIFGRLFTCFLQMAGFTCRMDDLILTKAGDKIRKDLIQNCHSIGTEAALEYVGMKDTVLDDENADHLKKQLRNRLENVLRSDEKMAGLDATMKSKTNSVTSSIISKCIPDHLLKPFPSNNMQLMTVSGAKGSAVNVSQISCLLGQQELEGRRVPTMVSGKTLPCFLPFETSARAGGFITGRFLTGIKPSEYFFHCMAGREGLIDTAVKTSRSGYLQRCLIKHLEGLRVNYDHTVRDADGSIVQFRYGEDALDVIKQKALTKFDFCAMNFKSLVKRYRPAELDQTSIDNGTAEKYMRKQKKYQERGEINSDYKSPVLSVFNPSRYVGAVSDRFNEDLHDYIKVNKSGLLELSSKDGKDQERKKNKWSGVPPSKKHFKLLMDLKYQSSLAEPGEAVGLLAAQSIGEPSTQMTLNTFHFAGFGAKNVTLGIPRLREIIMTASDHIKTPMMKLPLKASVEKEDADLLAKRMTRLVLGQIMDKVEVSESFVSSSDEDEFNQQRFKRVLIRLKFWPKSVYMSQYDISQSEVLRSLESRFITLLELYISREFKNRLRKDAGAEAEQEAIGVGTRESKFQESQSNLREGNGNDDDDGNEKMDKKSSAHQIPQDDDDDEDGANSDDEMADGDATDARLAGRRQQKATYDGPDDEDEQNLKSDQDVEDDTEDRVSDPKQGLKIEDDESSDTEESNTILEKVAKMKPKQKSSASRLEKLLEMSKYLTNFKFDDKNGRWCEIELEFPADSKKLLMVSIVENVLHKTVVKEVQGLSRAYVMENEAENDQTINVGAEGVNLQGLWDPTFHNDQIDLNQILTNDISAVLKTYGVEAARAAIVNEVAGVFGVYGISVDPRHLGLIADYMTFEGGYKAFNRIGMNSNPSPFAQMSFETTTSFLTSATLLGEFDDLSSPSARIVMGQVVKGGTGSFEILQSVKC